MYKSLQEHHFIWQG